jgi:hypothetical protein
MHPTKHSHWSVRDILALAIVALCALFVLAALIRPSAGFDRLLPLVVGAVLLVVRFYFARCGSE